MSPRSTASLAAILTLFACQTNPEQVGGSQLGDDGLGTPPIPPCGVGMVGISDLNKALAGQTSTPSEWRDGLASEQTGVATLRYDLASGQTCTLEANYVLTAQPDHEQLWWTYRDNESVDGKCTALQEYIFENVAVNLDLTNFVKVNGLLVGRTNTPKQGQASSTLSLTNNTSRCLYSPAELEALCATHGDISGEPYEPPIVGDGGWVTVIPNEAATPFAPYIGSSCIECLHHTCEYSVNQCEAASNCSVFTQCAANCDKNAECSGACPDPSCETGIEPGCSVLDCRNWFCDEVCGQEPCGGIPNQVYETTDAGTADASATMTSEAGAPGTEASEWRDFRPEAFTLTRSHTPNATWSGSMSGPRLTVEF